MTTRRQVFSSFCFDDDVMRIQQIRNMGLVDGDEPVSPNEWERLQRASGGRKQWIDYNWPIAHASSFLSADGRPSAHGVKYEIKKAWSDGKGLFGIHFHNLQCPRTGTCGLGANPFDGFTFNEGGRMLPSIARCDNPSPASACADIKANLANWIETAISSRKA